MLRRGSRIISYDEAYGRWPAYYGTVVSGLVRKYHDLIDRSRPVLDIGAGQGRTACYLAERGYEVDALDISAVGLGQIETLAADNNLTVHTHHTDFEDFNPDHSPYGGILALGMIQILPWTKIETLLHRINDWTAAGSIVFVSTFTTEDPRCAELAGTKSTGRQSFHLEADYYRTFLEPGEILTLFPGYEVIFHREVTGAPHNHGDGPEHYHCVAYAVFKKPKDRLPISDFSAYKQV